MISRLCWIALLAALSAPAGARAADEPRVLKPASAWTLDFADERCSLIREFADGGDRIRLQIDSYGQTGRGYGVLVSGNLIPVSDSAPVVELRTAYSPDTRERARFPLFAGTFQDQKAVSFTRAFVPEMAPAPLPDDGSPTAFERSVTYITFAFTNRKPFRLDTGSMAEPFGAMHKCVDDLVASWGIDPAERRKRTRAVQIADVPEGFTRIRPSEVQPNDHPGPGERRVAGIVAAAAGTTPRNRNAVPVRLMVDAAGKPTACLVQVAMNEAARIAACADVTKFSYQPALDAEGRPVADFIQFNAD